ncbi:MAG: hypothetical protein Q4G60_04160 [bacterium]|nr:hypothetical protein [bacterium]
MVNRVKIKEWINRPVIMAMLQNVLFLLLSLLVFHPHFEENDDVFIASIAEGAYGTRDSHLVYVNYCLGEIMEFFYRLCSGVRWHSVLQYISLMIAFTAFSYILIREKKHGKLLSFIFLTCVFYEGYVSLQYTKTAAVLTVIGYAVVLYCFRRIRRGEKSIEGFMALGMIMLVYGALLRISCFYMATAVFFVPFVIEMFSIRRETETGHKKKLVLAYLTTFIVLFMAVGVFQVLDRQAYSSQKDWKSYSVFNENRTQLLDYRYDLMNYETYGERLTQLGVSENDALLYLTWQFGDSGVFTNQLIEKILKDAPSRSFDIDMLKRLAAHLYEEIYGFNVLVMGIFCFIFWLIINRQKKNRYLLTYLGAVTAVVLCYYEYSGRWNHRVVFAILFAVFILLLQYGEGEERNVLLLAAGICVFINIGLLLQDQFDYNRYIREEADGNAQLAAYTKRYEDDLFLIDPFTDQVTYRYDVFRPHQEGCFANRTYLGGWLVRSPIYENVLDRYGYKNAFQALKASPEDERVYLIDNHYPEEKLLYLKEHYGKELSLESVENIGGYEIYKVCK